MKWFQLMVPNINYFSVRKSDVTSRIRTAAAAAVAVAGLASGAGLLLGTVPADAAAVTSAGQARIAHTNFNFSH